MFSANRGYKKKKPAQTPAPASVALLPRLSHDQILVAHAAAMERGADCLNCPLAGLRSGPVMGEIRPGSKLLVLADSPAGHEIAQGRPLIGPVGQKVDEFLAQGGLQREDCSFSNATLCQHPEDPKVFEYKLRLQHRLDEEEYLAKCQAVIAEGGNQADIETPPPLHLPSEKCLPRLQRDIEEAGAPVTLTLGGQALKSVADVWDVPYGTSKKVRSGQVRIAALKKQLGSPLFLPDKREEGRPANTILVACYLPAFAMKKGNYHWMRPINDWITRAAKIAVRGHIDWTEPPFILNPSVETVIEVLGRMVAAKARVSLDIETDKGTRKDGRFDQRTCRIRCIGFGAVLDGQETVICVPIRRISGHEWWPDKETKLQVLTAVVEVLQSCELLGHNLAFDTSVLLRVGLMTDRSKQWLCSMLAHRNTPDCDLPHDLGFVAARYLEVPAWKSMVSDKAYEDITDDDLALYNGRDVLSVLRLWPLIENDLYKYGTVSQYLEDQELAPLVRDMGDLGVFVDEVERGNLSTSLGTEVIKRRAALKKIVGDQNFNPNSTPQIQKFLFKTKKMIPVCNSKGKDLQEGEDPSTNAQSLVKMAQQQGADDEVKDFINNLLEYRAHTKLKSTYIDNLPVWYPNWEREDVVVPVVPPVNDQVFVKFTKKQRLERKNAGLDDAEGDWTNEEILPERSAVSRLSLSWRQHIVSSARLAVSPNIQAFPDRGRANCRVIIVAPPASVLVGADFDQIELRLYTVLADDKLLWKAFKTPGMDPHAYNAASMFCRKRGESVDKTYDWIMGLPDEHEGLARKKALAKGLHPDSDELKTLCALGREKGEKEKKGLRGYAKTLTYLELYGGSDEKLFSLMSTLRDKATGTLLFPGLLESDVLEWDQSWHATHPETREFQARIERQARIDGFSSAQLGVYRKRFFPGGSNKPGATYNHQIQSEHVFSMVLTSHGYQTISDIIEFGDGRAKVYVREGCWASAVVVPEGDARIWAVKTSNGRETEWSQFHNVRKASNEGYVWTRVCDLKPGDVIAKQPARELSYGEEMDSEDAYWCGYAVGNGSYSHHSLSFTIGHRWHAPLHDQVSRCLAWLGGHDLSYRLEWKIKDAESPKDKPRARFCTKAEATHALVHVGRGGIHLIRELGLVMGENCYTKRIPKKLWASDLSARKAFALGYLQADGCVKSLESKNPAVTANSCNKALLEDFQLFFDLIGIEATLSGPYVADRKGHLAWRLCLPGNQVFRSLGIGRKALERGGILAPAFEAERILTPKLPVPKDRKSPEWTRYVLQSRVRNGGSIGIHQLEQLGLPPVYGVTEVISSCDTGKTYPVYTLSVDHEDHSYVCEGIIAKNCTASSIANRAFKGICRRIPHFSWSKYTGVMIQAHDFICASTPEEREEEGLQIINEEMNTEFRGMPITATAKASKSWAKQ